VVQKNWSKGFKCRARTFPSKHRDLLSKGQNFEGVIAATAKAVNAGLKFPKSAD
jgi:hypothetical protein